MTVWDLTKRCGSHPKQNPLFSLALTLVPTEEKLCSVIKKGMALIPNLSCVLTYKIFNLEKYFLSRTQTISLPGSLLWDAKRKLVCSLWSWFELFKKGVSHPLLFDNFQMTRLCFQGSALAFSYFSIFLLGWGVRKINEKCHLWVWAH